MLLVSVYGIDPCLGHESRFKDTEKTAPKTPMREASSGSLLERRLLQKFMRSSRLARVRHGQCAFAENQMFRRVPVLKYDPIGQNIAYTLSRSDRVEPILTQSRDSSPAIFGISMSFAPTTWWWLPLCPNKRKGWMPFWMQQMVARHQRGLSSGSWVGGTPLVVPGLLWRSPQQGATS